MAMKVFITRKIPEAGLTLLKEAGVKVTEYLDQHELTASELIQSCKEHDGLLSVGHNHLDERFLQECRHLRAISLMSAGFDQVDIKAATRLGIAIGHTPGVLNRATSDIALLLMLAVSRNALHMHKTIAKGEWDFFDPTANLGIELYGKTLGIFGLGKIGFEMAKKSSALFNMKVIYHNRTPNEKAENLLKARMVSFDELLRQSDVLSVHCNLSRQTRGIFDRSAFKLMQQSAIFINTARGAIHQEKDLIDALRKGMIWGAGLDVTNPEPMSNDNPLLSMPNVCVLPHIGSATFETRSAMAERAAKNILAGLNGEQMPYVANPGVYHGTDVQTGTESSGHEN
jgi:glyoxylate reductase